MADYTEEQRVKQRWKSARVTEEWAGYFAVRIFGPYRNRIVGHGKSKDEAWADASRRLGNEFVDEVGPLAERKEG